MPKRIIFVTLLCLCLYCQIIATDKHISIDKVFARVVEPKTYYSLSEKRWGEQFEINSDIPGLKAYLTMDVENEKSIISVEWDGLKKDLFIENDVYIIAWRPKQPQFLYAYYFFEGGDYGSCSLHHVTVRKEKNKLLLEDYEITSNQPNTDFCWSNSGKYYVYSVQTSIEIREFESGKIWAPKMLVIEDGSKTIEIKKQDYPKSIEGFCWTENDESIVFFWRNHFLDDAPTGYCEMHLEQFNLE